MCWLSLQLQSGKQARFAFPHLHVVQSPLQEHLISSLHALDTSGMVIETGTHDCDSDPWTNQNGWEMESSDVPEYWWSILQLGILFG